MNLVKRVVPLWVELGILAYSSTRLPTKCKRVCVHLAEVVGGFG